MKTLKTFMFLFFCSNTSNLQAQSQAEVDLLFSDGDWELAYSMSGDQNKVLISKFPPFTMFIAEKSDGKWEKQLFPHSGVYEDGGPDISLDGKRVYFSSNRPYNSVEVNNNSDLWMSHHKDNVWSTPVHLGDKLNSADDELSPSVAKNGNLYFMKDTENGLGGYDIYMSTYIDGEYQKAINLGEMINSPYNEEDPYIDPSENFLIFMSQRPGDVGPCNLYISINQSGAWSEAVSLGSLVNTPFCDYSPFIGSDGYLYFISYSSGALDGVSKKSYQQLAKAYRSAGNGKPDIFKIEWTKILDSINITLP